MPRFQSEVKCEAFDLKMVFKFSHNKKGFALSLVLMILALMRYRNLVSCIWDAFKKM